MQIYCIQESKMKPFAIIIALATLFTALTAAPVGQIIFFRGEVQYKQSQNSAYKTPVMNAKVQEEGFLKIGLDSSAEIKWTNGNVSKVDETGTFSICKLLKEANSKSNIRSKVMDKVNKLKLQNTRTASSVAGIRREEAELKQTTPLRWENEQTISIDDAIALYDSLKFAEAIPAFQSVINQAPLKNDAELAHAYLIMIYDEQNDIPNRQEHIERLKSDFPCSTILEDLIEEK